MTTQIRGSTQIKDLNLDDLTDVNAPSPSPGNVLQWDNTAGEWIPATVSGAGAGNFLTLSDTPSSYSGQAGKSVVVNSGETGLEFTTISGGTGTGGGPGLGNLTALLIESSQVLTVSGSGLYSVDYQSPVFTGDVYTINGGSGGDMIILRSVSSSRTIAFYDASGVSGNIYILDGTWGSSIPLLDPHQTIMFVYDNNASAWLQVSYSDNTYTPS